jgi:thiol-disulfide isomerase/thioredoxin
MGSCSLAESIARTGLFALCFAVGCERVGDPAAVPRQAPQQREVPPPAAADAADTEPSAEALSAERHTATDGAKARPWIGVELRKEAAGVVVAYAYPNGPAAAAGLRPGDAVVRIEGQPVSQVGDVSVALERTRVGGSASVVVARAGAQRLFRVAVQAAPSRERLLQSIYVGHPAPSISTLEPLSGTVVPSFERLRGRVVVLEFWASFCVACRALTPELNRWSEENAVLGLRVLGVTMDPPDVAMDAASHFQIEYPVQFDRDGVVTRAYRGTALPCVFLVDQRGVVRDVVVGLYPKRLAALHELAERLLRETH